MDAVLVGAKLLFKSIVAIVIIALALVLLLLGFAAYYAICDWVDNKMVENITSWHTWLLASNKVLI